MALVAQFQQRNMSKSDGAASTFSHFRQPPTATPEMTPQRQQKVPPTSQHQHLPCVCTVCGDGASEHLHYGAICCFSCRAFFRRYANREGCVCVRGDGNCVVDVARRNDCMHCRLKMCVQKGMKKDYVRGPNQSLRKKRAEQGFRGRKRKCDGDKSEQRSRKRSREGPDDASEVERDFPPLGIRAASDAWGNPHANHIQRISPPAGSGYPASRLFPSLDQEAPFPGAGDGQLRGDFGVPPLELRHFQRDPLQLEQDLFVDDQSNWQEKDLPAAGEHQVQSQPRPLAGGDSYAASQSPDVAGEIVTEPWHAGAHESATFSSPSRQPTLEVYQGGRERQTLSTFQSFAEEVDKFKQILRNVSMSPGPSRHEHSWRQQARAAAAGPEMLICEPEMPPMSTTPLGSNSTPSPVAGPSGLQHQLYRDAEQHFETRPGSSHSDGSCATSVGSDAFPGSFLMLSRPRRRRGRLTSATRGGFWSSSSSDEDGNAAAPGDNAQSSFGPSVCEDDLALLEAATSPSPKIRTELESVVMPTMTFTQEEFGFVDLVRRLRNSTVGKINNAYYNEEHRDELTAILMSRGRRKPSFQFMERVNKSIMESSLEMIQSVLAMFSLTPKAKQVLMSENVSYACLIGAAVYTHGNDAPTFVEQARLSGMATKYIDYLEESGLAAVVPRMESHYLNPSPWAEKEAYEDEFNQILKQIGRHVGTDQFLTCLLIMAHLFSLSESAELDMLDRSDRVTVKKTRQEVALLLNRYLRMKYGPKKASSKTHHHFYLMSMLKRVSKIYMEKKLRLMQADRISDIQINE